MSFVDLATVPEVEICPGYMTRLVHGESMTVSHVRAMAGSPLPEHFHPQEQIVNVIEGTIELTVEGKKHTLGPGSVLVLPPNIKHSGRTLTDCYIIDVFHPVRKYNK